MTCSLKDLPKRVKAQVIDLPEESHFTRYLMDMGIRNNSAIKVIGRLFFGSNYIIEVGNERLVLRKQIAQYLKVSASL